jgi:hypothetical protein
MQLTAAFPNLPEGYIGFVEELQGANAQGVSLEEARVRSCNQSFSTAAPPAAPADNIVSLYRTACLSHDRWRLIGTRDWWMASSTSPDTQPAARGYRSRGGDRAPLGPRPQARDRARQSHRVIDSDYQGQLMVSCRNRGAVSYVPQPLERLAQLVIVPVGHAAFDVVDDYAASERSADGFGCTGR